MGQSKAGNRGYYEGSFVGEFLKDGRLVRLVAPFAYIDPFTMRWDVPSGWKVDGASIPPPLWSLVGSPFTGKYRDASVIHDYYCDTKQRPWGAVHRVFYDAMLTSEVDPFRAKLMYAAVCWGGPRWSTKTVNTYDETLREYLKDSTSRIGSNREHFPMRGPEFDDVSRYNRDVTTVCHFPLEEHDLKELERSLQQEEIAVEAVPGFVDQAIASRGLSPIEAE